MKWKKCGLWHPATSIVKKLGEMFLGRDSGLLDVRYYHCICCTCWIYDVVHMWFCVYIACVHFVYAMLCTGWYRKCCVNITYAVLGIDAAMYVMDMECGVHMVLCTCWICSIVYSWCYVHVRYTMLCTCGVACMLYMWCYVPMVLCACL